MFLLYWNVKHPKVSSMTSWDDLLSKAVDIINDLDLAPENLVRFKTPKSDLDAMGANRPKTWVELAVLEVVGERDLVPGYLTEALNFHRLVASRAAAHLDLLGCNTYRTPWLAAKLLLSDARSARDAAALVMKHLVTTNPTNRTSFEAHLLLTPELWQNLEAFAKAEPPVLLWRANGKFETLFKFLAPRFLLAPDNVLDAERVHARWQWLCNIKRAFKFPGLNAVLRLTHYLENRQAFPSHETLLPFLQAEALEHRLALETLKNDDVVAPGWRFMKQFQKGVKNGTGLVGARIRRNDKHTT